MTTQRRVPSSKLHEDKSGLDSLLFFSLLFLLFRPNETKSGYMLENFSARVQPCTQHSNLANGLPIPPGGNWVGSHAGPTGPGKTFLYGILSSGLLISESGERKKKNNKKTYITLYFELFGVSCRRHAAALTDDL